jgi:hypothetical protein
MAQRLSKSVCYLLLALIVPGIIVGANMIESVNLRVLKADSFPLIIIDASQP